MGKTDSEGTMNTYEELKKIFGERLEQNVPLAPYTTFKIGGSADLFYEAKNRQELAAAIIEARKLGISFFILGGGSNILIGDRGIRGLVIKNSSREIRIAGMKGRFTRGRSRGCVYVEADSGVLFNSLVRFTIEEGLGGLEMHLGLPGTVGGATFMNSKWTHPDAYVGDAVYQATILTPKNEIIAVPKSYLHFGYDKSSIQTSGDIVLSVVFGLTPAIKEHLWDVANESMKHRRKTQPQGVFSPGCTFQNITKAQALAVPTPGHTTSAGFLIDHAGLKGETIGDVQISSLHANFIVNRGKGTASDVVQLIKRAKDQVKEQFGVTLKEEIILAGEF